MTAAGVAAVVLRPARATVAAGAPAAAVPDPHTRVTVEVLNATRRSGLARLAARQLRREGFDVVSVGAADTALTATRVLARRNGVSAAERVAEALSVKTATPARDTLRRVDVSVWIGDDYRPPPDIRP